MPDDLMQTSRGFGEGGVGLSLIESDVFSAVGDRAAAAKVARAIDADRRHRLH